MYLKAYFESWIKICQYSYLSPIHSHAMYLYLHILVFLWLRPSSGTQKSYNELLPGLKLLCLETRPRSGSSWLLSQSNPFVLGPCDVLQGPGFCVAEGSCDVWLTNWFKCYSINYWRNNTFMEELELYWTSQVARQNSVCCMCTVIIIICIWTV